VLPCLESLIWWNKKCNIPYSLHQKDLIGQISRFLTLNQQSVNLSESNREFPQALWSTSPEFLRSSRCSQTTLEEYNVHSDSAKALSGCPEAPTAMDVHSECSDIWLTACAKIDAAETTTQLCRKLGTILLQQGILRFHNHKVFHLSYLRLIQLPYLLHHHTAFII
jgi:hypothetical protein